MQRNIKIIFAKEKQMKFISHLDLLRLFGRACRRAELPVILSQGYSPRFKISIKRALKLGIESRQEEVGFKISGAMAPEEFSSRLQAQLPEGISIRSISE